MGKQTATDDGLQHLTSRQLLTDLELTRANITDAGRVHVGRLRSLVPLSLQQPKITGTGLSHLRPPSAAMFPNGPSAN